MVKMVVFRALAALFFYVVIIPLQAQDLTFDSYRQETSSKVELDLDTAIYLTLTHSLTLHVANDEAHSRRCQVKQAGIYPNPGFIYEI